ncbi:YajG family lipoprotein [Pseudomonadota bacterium]
MKNLLIILITLIISSCTSHSQDTTLRPNPDIHFSEIGHNKLVRAEISDKRENKTIIGYRSDSEKKGSITNHQNISSLLKEQVARGLMRKDFFISSTSDTLVKVSLLNLEYKPLWGSLTRPSEISCTLEVSVKKNNNQKRYKRTYNKQITTKHIIFPPLASTNEKNITLCLDGIMESMLNDDKLLKIIAE